MAMEWTYLQVGMIGTNCYLVKDTATGKGAIIDPGGNAGGIQAAVEKLGMTPEGILLTHAHFDHTLAVNDLKAVYPGIRVYLHPEDRDQVPPRGMPIPQVTDFYGEGSTVQVGELTFSVLHTPGHSRGSVTLQCGDVLFTGDTLFRGSMGRTDLPGGSDADIFASLIRLYELPGDYQVCPGHEGLSTLEEERRSNYCIRYALDHR